MTVKIDQPIVKARVGTDDPPTRVVHPEPYDVPDELSGTRYKIKPATLDSAIYVIINDLQFEDGSRRPIEVFIQCRHMQSFQWITGLTRTWSALFRQPGPFPCYIVREAQEIFDPAGGYFIPGGRMVPSVVAHIGMVIEQHCRRVGVWDEEGPSDYEKEVLAKKKAVAEERGLKGQECQKCHEMSVVVMDGCRTCLSCADSHCG